jgi:anti-sigma factor RsiW
MNQERFLKNLFPFVEGDLDDELRRRMKDYVDANPEAAKQVEQVRKLKASVSRACVTGPAPQALRERIENALQEEEAKMGRETGIAAPTPTPSGPAGPVARRFPWTVPLALAAAIILCVIVWRPWVGNGGGDQAVAIVAIQTAEDVRARHHECFRDGLEHHHDQTLSRDLPTIAQRLGKRLNLAVIAPEFKALGFEFSGADRCGIRGHSGSHVVYQSRRNGEPLSVFTIERIRALEETGLKRLGDHEYFLSTEEGVNVVAWHGADETYIICGAFEEDELLRIAEAARAQE